MGTFDENRKAKEEIKKKNDIRKEKIAGYFFDLSKLSFAGMVIGSMTPMFTDIDNGVNWYSTILGVITSYVFAFFANRILR
ncbi:MAG: hypothetical protein H9802_02850 [Candidatus Phocaeicola faecipullorum]|nr:hypothetical protein [Candidatus Phocaeicola faecipullorum]